jgi:hypothetical protein
MLAVTSYPAVYIELSRARVNEQLDAFEALAGAAGGATAVRAFAPGYFNAMVLALDHYFLHRQRSLEGKDGSPLNEVRMLCNGIKEHDGLLTRDSTIKYDPAKSVTGIGLGDRIALDAAAFRRLAAAFFADIEKRYPEVRPS